MKNEILKIQSPYGDGLKNGEEDKFGNMLTVREASKFLHISVNSVYNLIYESRISYYKLKGKILFKRHDLLDFLESCRVSCVNEHLAKEGILNKIK